MADNLVPGVDYEVSTCPNCGKVTHTEQEMRQCMYSVAGIVTMDLCYDIVNSGGTLLPDMVEFVLDFMLASRSDLNPTERHAIEQAAQALEASQ